MNTNVRKISVPALMALFTGGLFPQIGWFLLAFGLVSSVFLLRSSDVTAILPITDVQTVQGEVLKVEETGMSLGKARVDAVTFSFVIPQGFTIHARSYGEERDLRPGSPVTVLYPSDNPGRARISGMRRSPFGPVVLLVLLFPLCGFGLVMSGISRGVQAWKLLRRGSLSLARIDDIERDSSAGDELIRYHARLVFPVTDSLQSRTMMTVRSKPSADQHYTVFFNPINPLETVILENLPGSLTCEGTGMITLGDPSLRALFFVLPGLCIISALISLVT